MVTVSSDASIPYRKASYLLGSLALMLVGDWFDLLYRVGLFLS